MTRQWSRVGNFKGARKVVHVCVSTTTSLWISFRERRRASPVTCELSSRTALILIHVIAATNIKRRRRPGQDASHFKTDDETGKMMIDEGDEIGDDVDEEDVAGTAYREAVTSADGFTRGPNGKIKFNKDTKKRRHDILEDTDDIEMKDPESQVERTPRKKKAAKPLGHDFKAKV